MTVELDERSLSIIQFIQNNPGCGTNHVSKAMVNKHISANMTTLNKIKDLIEAGILEDRRIGNGFHRLFINQENEFNRIYKQLIKIEDIITNEVKQCTIKVLNLYHEAKEVKSKKSDILKKHAFDIFENFMIPIGDVTNFMLHFLLFQTFEKVGSENYRRILNDKIVSLMLMTDSVTREVKSDQMPYSSVKEIRTFLNDVSRRDEYAKYDINVTLLKSSITMITRFVDEFLPETEMDPKTVV